MWPGVKILVVVSWVTEDLVFVTSGSFKATPKREGVLDQGVHSFLLELY